MTGRHDTPKSSKNWGGKETSAGVWDAPEAQAADVAVAPGSV